MSRTTTGAVDTALADSRVTMGLLFEAQLGSGTIYMWTGAGTITVDGNDYLGVGRFININNVQESSERQSPSLDCTLSGIPSDMLSIALTEAYQGRRAILKLALFNDNFTSVIADPVVLFDGIMNVMSINEGGEFSTITMVIESRYVDLYRSNERRYNWEDQRSRFPEDTGMKFVRGLQNKDVRWGK